MRRAVRRVAVAVTATAREAVRATFAVPAFAARSRGVGAAAARMAAIVAVGAGLGALAYVAGSLGTASPGAPFALAAPAPTAAVELQRDVFRIAGQLRCPVCVSESVAQSNAAVSIEMRDQIQDQLEAGRSEAEILASFQARYGDWILLEPPRRGIHLVVWLLPVIAAVLGAVALTVLVRRWVRKASEPVEDVDPEALARVRSELAARRGGSEAGPS